MHLITKVHVPHAPPQPRMCDPTSPFQRFDVSLVPAWSRSRASLASGVGMTMRRARRIDFDSPRIG
jgi:hypothetical protein